MKKPQCRLAPRVAQIHESQRAYCHSPRGMNELDAEYRSHSRKEEVNRGLTEEQALTEAKRCLDCANPGCMEGCPVGIDIPRFIKNIERGEFLEAAKTLKETSALPAVCGRVCPQEKQCESKCIH